MRNFFSGGSQMNDNVSLRSGGQILVDCLKTHGVNTAFCVPGESFLAVLDALYDAREQIRLFVCRQEGGAAFMAEAYGKLENRPGICFVTRGPGATNAAIGVHTAFQDSTPMILFIGQVGADVVEREAFQELDYRRMFGQMAKWVAQIDRAERIPEYLSHAFHLAVSGRPGPVVLALPEDMLTTRCVAPAAHAYSRIKAHPGEADLRTMSSMLQFASRPLVILGGGDWSAQACADIARFAHNFDLPVACSFRRQDLMDNRDPLYVGEVGIAISPELKKHVRESDLILAIGPRLGEMTSGGYTLFDIPHPHHKLVHIHPGAEELGRVYQADLMLNAGMAEFAAAATHLQAPSTRAWTQWSKTLREEYLSTISPVAMPGTLNLSEAVVWLRERLPHNAILTNGAGNFSGWVQRFHQYAGFRTQLAPTNGAMGYGVPAAIAAKLTRPERTVVCFAGDGDFLMNGQELATAVQYGAAVIFVIVNNGMYGTIRMHQEREYPARVFGTDLRNPDFVQLAQAYGAFGCRVEKTADFAPAFEQALAAGTPAVLELRIDPEAISTRASLTSIRSRAMQAAAAK
jgi:acetolactate synthase-1/2/3 large subunit